MISAFWFLGVIQRSRRGGGKGCGGIEVVIKKARTRHMAQTEMSNVHHHLRKYVLVVL